MSLRTPDLSVEIAVANMDLYPYDLPGRPSWGSNLEQLVPYLEQTGIRNFEIHPTETIVNDVKGRQAREDTELVERVVGSLHQTFNNGQSLIGKLGDRRGLSRSSLSVTYMGVIQAALSSAVPSVHYPERDMARLPWHRTPIRPDYPGSFPVIQAAAEVYRDFRVRTNADLIGVMSVQGIVGLCPDTVHARRKAEDGSVTPPIEEVWADQFSSGYTYQMHVSADRVDMKGRDPELAEKSRKEFKAFTSRRWQDGRDTEMGQMVTAAIENWVPPADLLKTVGRPVLRQVIEIPPVPSAFVNRVSQHARFAENLAEIAREAGAAPLLWQDQIAA